MNRRHLLTGLLAALACQPLRSPEAGSRRRTRHDQPPPEPERAGVCRDRAERPNCPPEPDQDWRPRTRSIRPDEDHDAYQMAPGPHGPGGGPND